VCIIKNNNIVVIFGYFRRFFISEIGKCSKLFDTTALSGGTELTGWGGMMGMPFLFKRPNVSEVNSMCIVIVMTVPKNFSTQMNQLN
jgi:hypothetical protein